MSVKEFENKTPVELRAELIKLRREQFNLRMAAAAGPSGAAQPEAAPAA